MKDSYKESYLALFRGVEEALRAMEVQNFGITWNRLIAGQRQAEELFLQSGEDTVPAEEITSN